MSKLKAILFDFGGCLDSDGMHSRTLFINAFTELGIMENISRETFQDAYSFADKKIIRQKLALGMGLEESNFLMVKIMLETMNYHDQSQAEALAKAISNVQASFLKKNTPTLEALAKNFRLGIISNFNGNLEEILKEHGIHQYFEMVLDSFHVGFSKPDIRIFEEALKRMNLFGHDCLFIGDNIERDVLPAKSLGMKTVLIHEPKHPRHYDPGPDAYVLELRELLDLTQKM